MIHEPLSNPQLTMSNLLKQAIKYRIEKKIDSTDLGVVLRDMVSDNWDPSRHLIRTGVPTEFYEIFHARCHQSTEPPDIPEWAKPHRRKKRRTGPTEL
jgi:hypothetical protein